MKLIHLLKIFLRNATNPTMNLTDFFQSQDSKVNVPFLQSNSSPSFFSRKISPHFTP